LTGGGVGGRRLYVFCCGLTVNFMAKGERKEDVL